MKLLLYVHSWAPMIGGVETSTMVLAQGLAKSEGTQAGDKISVTLATQTPANGMDDSALPFRVVRRPGFRQLIRLIRDANIVHLAGPCLLPSTIAWLMRKHVAIEHHGYQANCPNGLLFKQPSQTVCAGHFAARQYGECMRCCSSSQGFFGAMRTVLLTFPRRWLSGRVAANIMITNHLSARLKLPRSRTIYYGGPDAPLVSVQDILPASDAFDVAYVGRLVAEKGLPLLIKAAKCLQEQGVTFKLFFIGSGPEQGQLEQMVRLAGLSDLVVFTGDLRGAEFEKMVSRIAVVVMPSIWEETAGLSAIEQMMRGRVVVATDIGGLGEVVGDAGLKFALGDWRELASCLRKVAEDPNLAKLLGSTAHARAMRLFRLNRMIQDHSDLYREALR
jgi:glycogen synthase